MNKILSNLRRIRKEIALTLAFGLTAMIFGFFCHSFPFDILAIGAFLGLLCGFFQRCSFKAAMENSTRESFLRNAHKVSKSEIFKKGHHVIFVTGNLSILVLSATITDNPVLSSLAGVLMLICMRESVNVDTWIEFKNM